VPELEVCISLIRNFESGRTGPRAVGHRPFDVVDQSKFATLLLLHGRDPNPRRRPASRRLSSIETGLAAARASTGFGCAMAAPSHSVRRAGRPAPAAASTVVEPVGRALGPAARARPRRHVSTVTATVLMTATMARTAGRRADHVTYQGQTERELESIDIRSEGAAECQNSHK
jgi:hypothetical protein